MPFQFAKVADWPLEPRSVYLALHHRAHDPLGEFHWSIVLTMDGIQCLYHHLKRLPHSTPWQNYYEMESLRSDQWSPGMSSSLLCLFHVEKFARPDQLIATADVIREASLDIFVHSKVSTFRATTTFSNRTFAMDVLARAIPRVSGTASTDFELCCRSMAIQTRHMAVFQRPQALYVPGVYAVYVPLETRPIASMFPITNWW
ncbi:hypothetical protein F5Y04DRAFT_284076 [Hypomontagnella monticulosa]|nr:hypothetical protein F5Y04DRAFT_284076 [Hypomontagnella monticulosa]